MSFFFSFFSAIVAAVIITALLLFPESLSDQMINVTVIVTTNLSSLNSIF